MKKKIVSYEEAEISKELKEKCIKYLKDNEINLYYDYRDKLSMKQIESLMKNEENFLNLENEIWENSLEWIFEEEAQLIENMKNEIEELQSFDVRDIREEFLDYICININIDQLLKNTPAVNVRVIINSNYEGVNYTERGEGDFAESEYIQDIKRLLKEKYNQKSFQNELDNICSTVNQLMFYGKIEVKDLIGIQEKFKKSITIPSECMCGFFDTWSGSGSVLEIQLTEDITLPKQYGKTKYDDISIILDETNKYSVMETYGLCNIPKISIDVK